MAKYWEHHLEQLLPTVYRIRDAENGYSLKALTRVIGEQIDHVYGNIEQLYDNWFIESCEPWVVPYLGELLEFRGGISPVERIRDDENRQRLRNTLLFPRSEVANTVRSRRKKGTLAVLERLAQDIAGWYAQAEENFRFVLHTEKSKTKDQKPAWKLPDPNNHPDDRQPFLISHQLISRKDDATDSHRISTLKVWRHDAIKRTQVFPKIINTCQKGKWILFTIDPLGRRIPLCFNPLKDPNDLSLASNYNLPSPITLGDLNAEQAIDSDRQQKEAIRLDVGGVSPLVYGRDKSLEVYLGMAKKEGEECKPSASLGILHRSQIEGADLSRFAAKDAENPFEEHNAGDHIEAMVDSANGLIAIRNVEEAKSPFVRVTSYIAGLKGYGGGEYYRPIKQSRRDNQAAVVHRIRFDETKPSCNCEDSSVDLFKKCCKPKTEKPDSACSKSTLLHLSDRISKRVTGSKGESQKPLFKKCNCQCDFELDTDDKYEHVVLEFTDSGTYVLNDLKSLKLNAGQTLELRAKNCQPVIKAWQKCTNKDFTVDLVGNAKFILDGVVFEGEIKLNSIPYENDTTETKCKNSETALRSGETSSELARPVFESNHCTLTPCGENTISLTANLDDGCIRISNSICGGIQTSRDDLASDVFIEDSIVDGELKREWNQENAKAITRQLAISGPSSFNLNIVRSTVLGKANVRTLSAEDSLFTNTIIVQRRNVHGMRFCGLGNPRESRTPQRYYCQHHLDQPGNGGNDASGRQTCNADNSPVNRKPIGKPSCWFLSTRFGDANYAVLRQDSSSLLRRGSEMESEMGVHHDLYMPQREDNLKERVEEYTPAGMTTIIHYES